MSPLRLAYGSNGLSDHRLADACALLAEHGYDGIALTLDHWHLDPFADDLDERVAAAARLLADHDLDVVVETGGRFVLDPFAKHQPNLASDHGRRRRLDFYARAADIAAALDAPVLHLWSGIAPDGVAADEAWERVVTGTREVVDIAGDAGVVLGFEPEPGMVVDTIATFERLAADLGDPPELGITLDIGHCRCLEDDPEPDCVRRVADRLVHVQVEDMRRGVHEHLPFGTGEVDLAGSLAALQEIDYDGLVSVELPRHGHTAHTMVPDSMAALRDATSPEAAA
ncbi:sugar phosphate isomerase/epimerase family protein [Salsipaludibacter albus]|uniref:sugar phosphate isomerase/epimerase family protein n=1 Tax=Salsipaludibacter albus TaxID=2849650 RepID=UPI001EE437AE|nr:sugar phosphate isomerase/epimerase family protein [Salsipaludibacter albus]MBY5164343.1 sugar phosphate isomerase/epimerase [Salsipaludibacter albus]